MPKWKDITGQTFGRLTALEKVYVNKDKQAVWKCRCTCGNITYAVAGLLGYGARKSCGCINEERTRAGVVRRVHGGAGTYLYRLWKEIKSRCYNKNVACYKNYGGRGISMYEPWRINFVLFKDYILNNLGDKLFKEYSIDRIDNDKGYVPGNIRWANALTQGRNKRSVKMSFIIANQILEDYAKSGMSKLKYSKKFANFYGCAYQTIYKVLRQETWSNPNAHF